jgi:hypothetical protein
MQELTKEDKIIANPNCYHSNGIGFGTLHKNTILNVLLFQLTNPSLERE